MNKNIYFGLLCLIVAVPVWGMKKEETVEVPLFDKNGRVTEEGATYKIMELLYKNDRSSYEKEGTMRMLLEYGLDPNGRGIFFANSYLNMCIAGGSVELVKVLLENPKTQIWKEDVRLAENRFLTAKTPAEKTTREEIFKLVEAAKYRTIEPDTRAQSNNQNVIAEGTQQLTLENGSLSLTMGDTSSSSEN